MSGPYGKNGRLLLEPPEQKKFLKTVVKADELQEKCFCLIFVYTGCRMGEALGLRPEHIEPEKCLINFETLKQKEPLRRVIRVPEYVMILLCELMATQNGGRLFDFSRWKGRRIIKKYMGPAGLDGFKANSTGLRRAFAVSQLLGGAFVTDIQEWLGHKNLKTTQGYLEHNDPDKNERVQRGWPDIGIDAPPSTPATITATEIKFFNLDVEDVAAQVRKMNAYIQSKAAEGWAVDQMDHIQKCEKNGDHLVSHSKGMLVVLVPNITSFR